MKRILIITGASSGMGREFALQLDKRLGKTDEFWLIARRKEKLQELSDILSHKCVLFGMDLTDKNAMDSFSDTLQIEAPQVQMLINCSGYGVMGAFLALDKSEQLGMIDLNCRALTEMTYLCIPYMKKGSRIIQLASSAAFMPQADFAVYAASKSYVLSFSRALNEELKEKGIAVTAVCPGPVKTEFFERAEKDGKTLALKKYAMVEAGRVVSDALLASKMKWDISVCSIPIILFMAVAKILPHSLILKICYMMK